MLVSTRSAGLVGFLVVLACAVPGSAHGATITVDTANDAVAADGHCSLREAISASNTDSAPFAGAGECAAGSGADTITLGAGTFKVTRTSARENSNAGGDFDILGTELSLVGAGAGSTTIDGNHLDRVLDVRPGRIVTLRGLTITGGTAPAGLGGANHTGVSAGQAGIGDNGDPGEPGGGIRNSGTLTVLDCVVTGNVAGAGGHGGTGQGAAGTTAATGSLGGPGIGGVGGAGGSGGGIFTDGVLSLTRTVVSGNAAGAGGAAGAAIGGQGGGGTSSSGGAGGAAIGGVGGTGGSGGGIAESGGGGLDVVESAITGNSAGQGGGGVVATEGGAGGVAGGASGAGGLGGSGVGGVGGPGGNGGGVFAQDASTVAASLVDNNTAGAGGSVGSAQGGLGGPGVGAGRNGGNGGGGIGWVGGSGGGGGGLFLSAGTVRSTTVTGNHTGVNADGGPGIGGQGGGSVSGTGGNGGDALGGVGPNGPPGGGIHADTRSSITHATITANTLAAAAAGGAGTAGLGGNPGGSAGTGTAGTAGSAATSGGVFAASAVNDVTTLSNSIVAANATPSCTGVADGGHDISFPDTTCPGATVDPLLAALADNGGQTKTQALGAGSPALDAVPAGSACAATDQRGVSRPQGAGCDIGAYEHAPPVATTGDAATVTTTAATLQGQVNPNARPTTYHFEFGTTTAYGTSTADQQAAAGVDAAPVSAVLDALAPSTTFHFRLVATNADGTSVGEDRTFTTAAPPPPPQGAGSVVDRTAPVFLSASLSPKLFAVDRRGKAEKPVTAAAVKRGTTITFRLSEAARVVFTVRHGKRLAGRFAMAAKSGTNRKRFRGRIGKRALSPGKYTLTLTATDRAGNKSKPKRLSFRIVRRR